MSDDLVKRLRESGSRSEIEIHEDREEAADRIEELEAKLKKAVEALDEASHAPSTAMAVANWFLTKSWSEPQLPHCDQMKLYKLVYYAHAWYLANFGKPLFEEDVEAWPHGPVVRDLYIEFKNFGRKPITCLGTRLEERDGKFILVTPEHDGSLDEFLNAVWDNYKQFTGIKLSNATHANGEPWEVVSRHFDLEEKPTIPNNLIEAVFKEKIGDTDK